MAESRPFCPSGRHANVATGTGSTILPARRRTPLAGTRPCAPQQAPGGSPASQRSMVRLAVATPDAPGQTAPGKDTAAFVFFDNNEDPDSTVIKLCGRNETALLMRLTSIFISNDLNVRSANINTDAQGEVCDVFRVTDSKGKKLAAEAWPALEAQLVSVLNGSSRSSKPAIHGVMSKEETAGVTSVADEGDARALEMAAVEMANAAAALVSIERDLIALVANATDEVTLVTKQAERAEASSQLERKMTAMQVILTSRRTLMEASKAAEPVIPAFMQPPPTRTTGPGAGNGYEIILQGFNWESCKHGWYKQLVGLAPEIAAAGFTAVWLPPASNSVSAEGYLPRDLYDLNSKYGTEAELRDLISILHEVGLKAIADIVINHRCAHYQGSDGRWNKFGGRLAWDNSVICANNASFGGTGSRKNTEDYPAAPNLDHSQERVRKDIIEWMRWLRNSIGFDGWRFDFVKGYEGRHVGEYVNATVPEMAFGEYWDTCSYSDGVLSYNQDMHRQQTINWCDKTGATCAAFDFTLKGILQEAVGRKEYWRLADSQGRPSGVLGVWPSRAVTFLENHDTGSTLQHWPFPWNHVAEGYCYLLTHPGTPCVFYDHFFYDQSIRTHILELMAIRKRFLINYKSEVNIRKAYNDLYAAIIDGKVAMKIGPGNWSPTEDSKDVGARDWVLLHSGPNFAVWEAVK